MAMAGERVPAGTGETSVATQKNNTTPPSEKTDHRVAGSCLRDADGKAGPGPLPRLALPLSRLSHFSE